MASVGLPDGSVLHVGKSTAERLALWGQFRRLSATILLVAVGLGVGGGAVSVGGGGGGVLVGAKVGVGNPVLVADGSAGANGVGVGRMPHREVAAPGLAQETSRLEMRRKNKKWRIEGPNRAESRR